MIFLNRAAGIFLHPTSLPSKFGIGDLGENAYRWIDILAHCRQLFWQVCPLGPTGFGDSPYQSLCAFAGNTLLISPQALFERGLLRRQEIDAFPRLPDTHVDYGTVIVEKEKVFRKAYERFEDSEEFETFCDRERYWLDNFVLFTVIKQRLGGTSWVEWEAPLKLRFPAALDELLESQWRAIRYCKFQQFVFHAQWMELRKYAQSKGVKIIGDMPYYVAFDSSDTWAAPELFELNENGIPLRVAGVPPDYFSETGQLWGNPLYQWENMRQDGYAWWIRRIGKALELADYLRLDHFRGFESYWAVPADASTAVCGKWEPGPGENFFTAVKNALGAVPIIAEDLGEITHGVEELRRRVGLPGMKVLQFAFDGDPGNPYLPYNVCADSIMYTGTHDNDTSRSWFEHLEEQKRSFVEKYLGCGCDDFPGLFLRLAYSSPSRLCIIPVQDVLGLPEGHRMNTPGVQHGNWRWRLPPKYLDPSYFTFAGELVVIYGRAPEGGDDR